MRLQKRCLAYFLITLVLNFVVIVLFTLKNRVPSFAPFKLRQASTIDPWIQNRWLHVKITTLKKVEKIKTILLWTTFFGAHDYVPQLSNLCPLPKCIVTSNRQLLNQSDALVFHLRDINVNDMPVTRVSSQVWILLHHESPPHTPNILKSLNRLFNWTATYRSDSEIFLTPTVKEINKPIKQTNYAENKTRMVAWFVSNCQTPSNRERFVKELAKSIPIDIYGTCGQLSCLPKMSRECYSKIAKTYRYYLALENSICKDYVTEKFFNVLDNNMIPVVMGGANYSAIAPPNSYIDALSFESPRHLVRFLLTVAKDNEKYNSYFKWKSSYEVTSEHYGCQICRQLHQKESNIKSYNDLERWWFHDAKCRSWEANKNTNSSA